MTTRLVLVIEPEDGLGLLSDRVLRLDGWSVYRVSTFKAALHQLFQRDFDLVTCEYSPEAGLDEAAVAHLHTLAHGRPFLVTSTNTDGARVARSLRTTFLRQPVSTLNLDVALGAALAAA
ncbi:MAG: hypothetical protein K1X87_08510 [Dehalococcoidia bacterium]|nr:hypothetical protein [Dehalococcoidia bacterium]